LVRAAKNGSGGAFYVNEHGLVYAPCFDPKENTAEDAWSAVYVGKINYANWLTPAIVSQKISGRY
jgi:transposase